MILLMLIPAILYLEGILLFSILINFLNLSFWVKLLLIGFWPLALPYLFAKNFKKISEAKEQILLLLKVIENTYES